MRLLTTTVLRYSLCVGLGCLAMVLALVGSIQGWAQTLEKVRQPQMLLPPDFDTVTPEFSRIGEQRHVLLFSKTNGYRRHRAIAAAQRMLEQIAADRSWFVYSTDNAAIFSPRTLNQFDSIVLNNCSGPVFTADQQRSLDAFVATGGGVFSLREQPADPAFRKRFAEQIRRASAVNRPIPGRSKTPDDRRSRQPVPASRNPAPQP